MTTVRSTYEKQLKKLKGSSYNTNSGPTENTQPGTARGGVDLNKTIDPYSSASKALNMGNGAFDDLNNSHIAMEYGSNPFGMKPPKSKVKPFFTGRESMPLF